MKQQDRSPDETHRLATRLGAAVVALLCLGFLASASASAAYEGVGNFAGSAAPVAEEKFSEEVQLGGVGGMAVNYTGAGGVEPGTVYAAGRGGVGHPPHLSMFTPIAGGGLSFSKAWEVTALKKPSYEQCGPALGTKCLIPESASAGSVDVEVDQTTGNLYVYQGQINAPEAKRIIEYTPDGSTEITRFGEDSPGIETVAESPGKLHLPVTQGNIAVNGAGDVYVFDTDGHYKRLMVFSPQSPGEYEHYAYAGEVAAKASGRDGPAMPVTDAAGNLYVAEPEGTGLIQEYAPEAPSAYPATPAKPICKFEYPKAGIESIAVNPETGEVFFFSYKTENGFEFKLVHQLGPCDEATGEFKETGKFEVRPERGELAAMAVDPAHRFEPARAPGILYAGTPSPVPNSGVGTGEPGQSSLGYIFASPLALPPEVRSESVSHVTTTTAQLHAAIDPKGSASHYFFQYETEAEYEANDPAERFAGAIEAPPGGAELGVGKGALPAAAGISGLSPDTSYRYRVLATSHCDHEHPEEVCEGQGADQSFHTFPTQAPGLPDERAYELVSPPDKHGGEVFPVKGGTGEPEFAWAFPMQSAPDGEAVVYEGQPFSPTEGAVGENQYISRRDSIAGWQTTDLSPALARRSGSQGYRAFSADLSRGLLSQANPTLSPAAPSGYDNLYAQPSGDPLALRPLLEAEPLNRPAGPAGKFELRYAGASADLSRIFFEANDALSEETPFAPEAKDGGANKRNLYEWHEGSLALVNVMPGNAETEPGASFGVPGGSDGVGGSHAISQDGNRAFWSDEAGQLYVREGAETTRAIPDPGKFLAASADGSKVLLTTGLLYDLETETTVDLTEGKGGLQGLAGQSEDLSNVYFLDAEVLTEEENDQGAKAQKGEENLYAWHEGATRYVATLLAKDSVGQASPDGRFLAFASEAPLSGYDNTGPCGGNVVQGIFDAPCLETFLYDSATERLTCASCDPSGASPLGRASLPTGGVGSPRRYLTDEGRLFFDTQDSLVPADTNEGVGDVYEFEPNGVGSCKRAAGCASLISAGHEPGASDFLAIDQGAKNVFFTTRDQLVLKDKDELFDLYDAREGGGIPSETEVSRGECQGEACQPPVSAPNDPTPGSSSFEGAGNVVEPKSARKHKKKRHAKKHKRAAKHNRGGVK